MPSGPQYSVAQTACPGFFQARSAPQVNVLLVHYGNAVKEADLERVGHLLSARFGVSTQGLLSLQVLAHAVVPLKTQRRDLTAVAAQMRGPESSRSQARMTRLWYYYQPGLNLVDELYAEMRKMAGLRSALARADAVLVLAEPQFEGMGFAEGAFAVTEQPVEVAWGAANGGRTVFETDARVVDELIHELGHVLGLHHAAAQCDPARLDYRACCQASPSGDDVMSYCRKRSDVSDSFFFGFTECNLRHLRDAVVPRMREGAARPSQVGGCQ
jgi:hypothetical protein